MGAKRIRQQVAYIVSQGWNPAIEHVEPERAGDDYWHMWKLPLFGEKDIDAIIKEAAECHKANPDNHVRLVGYDNLKQSLGASMVVYRGKGYYGQKQPLDISVQLGDKQGTNQGCRLPNSGRYKV